MKEVATFIIKALIVIFALSILLYLSAITLVIVINEGWDFSQITNMTIGGQFSYLFESVISYWKFYIDNSDVLNSDSHNNFVIKLWLTTLSPILLLLMIAWFFGRKFIEWQPFKNR